MELEEEQGEVPIHIAIATTQSKAASLSGPLREASVEIAKGKETSAAGPRDLPVPKPEEQAHTKEAPKEAEPTPWLAPCTKDAQEGDEAAAALPEPEVPYPSPKLSPTSEADLPCDPHAPHIAEGLEAAGPATALAEPETPWPTEADGQCKPGA